MVACKTGLRNMVADIITDLVERWTLRTDTLLVSLEIVIALGTSTKKVVPSQI